MKNILIFNPKDEKWVCKKGSSIRKEEIMLCILESVGFKVHYTTREQRHFDDYPHFIHSAIMTIEFTISRLTERGLRTKINSIYPVLSVDFLIYFYSIKPLF